MDVFFDLFWLHMPDAAALLPPDMPWATWWMLVCASFITSMMTATLGIGGGLALLALMAQVMPPIALIPVHGAVQAGSNLGRVLLMFRSIHWPFVGPFAFGALIGGFVGGQITVTLPAALLQALLGGFILLALWGPSFPAWSRSDLAITVEGLVSTICTMFLGATGPFVATALRPWQLRPPAYVGTFAMAMALQHGLKLIIFLALGFAFAQYLPLITVMMVTGFAGTWIGTHMLARLSPGRFALILKVILTLLAVRLLSRAIPLVFSM